MMRRKENLFAVLINMALLEVNQVRLKSLVDMQPTP